jgi:hypothetical protein
MKKRKLKIVLICVAALILLAVGGFYIYTLDYYRAEDAVYSSDGMKDAVYEDNTVIFYPEGSADSQTGTGIIFYPGGKVEAIAYAPVLLQLAEEGFTCVLIEMPLNLAVFDINAADDVYAQFPKIQNWYLMGHSLGGAMASSYCKENYDKLEGLILLGAYPLNDAIDTLAIYGSEDFGLDTQKLEGYENVICIEGGNHAYFGNYGEQKGDGQASITRDEQQKIAVSYITEFIGKGE